MFDKSPCNGLERLPQGAPKGVIQPAFNNEMSMKVAIIYAYPVSASLNASLRDAMISRLEAIGHSVLVSDLMRWGGTRYLTVTIF